MNLDKLNSKLDEYDTAVEVLENRIKSLLDEKDKYVYMYFYNLMNNKNISYLYKAGELVTQIESYLESQNELERKIRNLYFKSFNGLSSYVIKTHSKINDNEIVLGKRGFGIRKWWHSNAEYSLSFNTIYKIFTKHPEVKSYIKNSIKLEIFEIFEKYLKDFTIYEFPSLQKIPIPDIKEIHIIHDNKYSTKRFSMSKKSTIKFFSVDIRFRAVRLYDGLSHFTHTLSLPRDVSGLRPIELYYYNYFIDKVVDFLTPIEKELADINKNNKIVYEKLYNDLKKYLGVYLL